MSKALLANEKVAALVDKSVTKAVKEERRKILALIKDVKDENKSNEDKQAKRTVNYTLTNLTSSIKEAAQAS